MISIFAAIFTLCFILFIATIIVCTFVISCEFFIFTTLKFSIILHKKIMKNVWVDKDVN